MNEPGETDVRVVMEVIEQAKEKLVDTMLAEVNPAVMLTSSTLLL